MKWFVAFSALSAFLFLLLFQNCSGVKSIEQSTLSQSNNEITGDLNSDTPSVVEELELDFKAGEIVTSDNIPSQRLYLLSELNDYLTETGFKAIALTLDGYGFMMFQRNGSILVSASQEEANRRALEACQFTSSNRPCAIFAEGNVIKYDSDQFLSGMTRKIDLALKQYKPELVPLITDAIRNNQLKSYTNGKTHKALALSITGGGGMWVESNDVEFAKTKAVESCEAQPKNDVCFLYAVNGNIVLSEAALIQYFKNHIEEAQ